MSKERNPATLYAFYDLGISPVTFNIIQFLVLAEAERKRLGCDSLHVVFVPGPRDGFSLVEVSTYRRLGQSECDADLMRWRLRNILVPLCWLIPSCRQLTVCSSVEQAQVLEKSMARYIFPRGYTVLFPKEGYSLFQLTTAQSRENIPASIQATVQAKRFIGEWIRSRSDGKKVITVSIRNSSYQPERNSNVSVWGEFIRSLDPNIYYPVIMNDTWTAFRSPPPELDGLVTFPEACWNVELRTALYELSYLNLFTNSGPILLCIFNSRTRCLVFKILPPGPYLTRYFRSEGLEPGSQYKYTGPFQQLIWKDDTLPVIQEEFQRMCDKIDNGG